MACSNRHTFPIVGSDNLVYKCKCFVCSALYSGVETEAESRLGLDTEVSYELYSSVIDSLNPNLVLSFDFKMPSVLKALWSDLKELAEHLKSEFDIGIEEVIKAFQQKSVFALLKGVAFSLKRLVSAIHAGVSILSKELYKALSALHESGAFKHVEKSAKVVDAILEAHPVLKKLVGPAVAGILLAIYLKSSFLGDLNKDLALVDSLLACLKGNFTIYELFASKDGIYALATLAIGLATGASAISYGYSALEKTLKFLGSDGKNVYNIALAIFYAAARKAKLHFNAKEGTSILGMKLEAKARLQTVGLTKKQKQLDINQDGKIDSEDLKKVREGELNAKQRLLAAPTYTSIQNLIKGYLKHWNLETDKPIGNTVKEVLYGLQSEFTRGDLTDFESLLQHDASQALWKELMNCDKSLPKDIHRMMESIENHIDSIN